jgi:hypothetical protein
MKFEQGHAGVLRFLAFPDLTVQAFQRSSVTTYRQVRKMCLPARAALCERCREICK